jgi:hypothetical protein
MSRWTATSSRGTRSSRRADTPSRAAARRSDATRAKCRRLAMAIALTLILTTAAQACAQLRTDDGIPLRCRFLLRGQLSRRDRAEPGIIKTTIFQDRQVQSLRHAFPRVTSSRERTKNRSSSGLGSRLVQLVQECQHLPGELGSSGAHFAIRGTGVRAAQAYMAMAPPST